MVYLFPPRCTSNIIPDNTLGGESSQVIENFQELPSRLSPENIETITGGAQRGINLFHSFREFNVSEERGAYFFTPNAEIQNILTRVTGSNPSEILGTLGSFGSSQPNLFLINPNGILFGERSSLDLQGSFVASTANGLQFGEQGVFSATNPEAPALLTVNPSALFFNQINQNAAIRNSSIEAAGIDASGVARLGLRVPDGKNLLLVGGNVNMDGGRLNALGGRIELGGLAEPGTVALDINGDNFKLGFSDNVTRADVLLTNQAGVFVQGAGGGDIAVNARNIEILRESVISAGIGQGLGTPETVAGDIILNATGEIQIANFSAIGNLVRSDSIGNGGNITINSDSFSLHDGSQLVSTTRGQGSSGIVNINVLNTLSLDTSAVLTFLEGTGENRLAGDIKISAGFVFMNDSQLASVTFGEGNAGNVIIDVNDKLSFDAGSTIFASVQKGAIGNGGSIKINAGSLSVKKGSQITADSFGKGNAGDITITAREAVSFDGRSEDERLASVAGSILGKDVEGKAGDINIKARSFSLTNGAQLQTSTLGKGDGGNVNIEVNELVSLDGTNPDGNYPSSIITGVELEGIGNGGDINITGDSLSLTNGGRLIASTLGKGNSGNIQIKTSDIVSISGVNPFSEQSSGLFTFSDADTNFIGKGGDIIVDTKIFRISDGALLDARTLDNNRGGDITVSTNVFETLNGGQITTTTSNNGRAGKITVNAGDKVIISGSDPSYSDRVAKFPGIGNIGANSGLFVSSTASGTTGDIEINSPQITLDNQGKLNANSASGDGGNINLTSDLLLLRRNSQITTDAGTEQQGGDGGNIDINSKFIVAPSQENSDITANAFEGRGGNINILSQGIFGIQPRQQESDLTSDITASSNLGVPGNLNITDPDDSSIRNNLDDLPENQIDTNALIANSCISRSNKRQENSFQITGSGGLRNSPGDELISQYSTGEVRTIEPTSRSWKKGDRIVEPTGAYKLSDGRLLLSRSC